MTERSRNLSSSLLLFVAAVYWYSAAADFRELSRLFPRVIAIIVGAGAVVLAALTLSGRGPVIRLSEGDAGQRHMRSGTLIAVLLGWTALIPLLGLLIASVIGVSVMGYITFRGHHGTVRAIIIALVSVIAFYLLFTLLLNVPFPLGLFG